MNTNGMLISLLSCAIADLEGILPEHDPSGDREHPAWKTLDELKEKVKELETTTMLFSWGIEDVQGVREDLNDEQAFEVLERCEDDHDADIGMNWTTIEVVADIMFPKPEDDE